MTPYKDSLLAALSELGLEDWIPLPEAVSSPEIARAAGPDRDDPGAAVSAALSQLVRDGEVRIYKGRALQSRPTAVATEQALELLSDPHWRRWGREQNEERLFFANAQAATRWDEDA